MSSEALEAERSGNVAMANGLVIEARRHYRRADAYRAQALAAEKAIAASPAWLRDTAIPPKPPQ